MKARKSTVVIIICLTVAAASFGLAMVEFYPLFKHITFGSDVIDFKEHKKDFQTIVGWLSEKYGKTDVDLAVTVNKKSGVCKVGGEEVPVELSEKFFHIEDALGQEVYLEKIEIRDSQIWFCLWGKSDIVYSPNISPKWMNGSSNRIAVDRICSGWYWVRTIK